MIAINKSSVLQSGRCNACERVMNTFDQVHVISFGSIEVRVCIKCLRELKQWAEGQLKRGKRG